MGSGSPSFCEALPRRRYADAAKGHDVVVETVEEKTHSIVLIRIRLPEAITEHARLATEEWVQLQLIALDGAQSPAEHVYVARYV